MPRAGSGRDAGPTFAKLAGAAVERESAPVSMGGAAMGRGTAGGGGAAWSRCGGDIGEGAGSCAYAAELSRAYAAEVSRAVDDSRPPGTNGADWPPIRRGADKSSPPPRDRPKSSFPRFDGVDSAARMGTTLDATGIGSSSSSASIWAIFSRLQNEVLSPLAAGAWRICPRASGAERLVGPPKTSLGAAATAFTERAAVLVPAAHSTRPSPGT